MSTGPVNYEEAYREKCRVAENTRLALMKALARINRLTEAGKKLDEEAFHTIKFYSDLNAEGRALKSLVDAFKEWRECLAEDSLPLGKRST